MRSCSLLFRSLLLFSLMLGSSLLAASDAGMSLRVMTFNLRYASDQPPNAWTVRRPVMRALIEREAPDVIGTQEGLHVQLRHLAADLPAYDWIGLGREGGSRGEFMAVFFRRDRLEPLAYDHFWLSDTPELIGSMTWGNRFRRMVTWVRFRERASGREFSVWNTHFDHEVEAARVKSARLIRERLAAVAPSGPLVLLGDFNCAAGTSAAFEILTHDSGLVDTWTAARERTNEGLNTFHNFEPPKRDGVRIDWILARGAGEIRRAAIVDHHERGQWPSDHFPVVAELTFP